MFIGFIKVYAEREYTKYTNKIRTEDSLFHTCHDFRFAIAHIFEEDSRKGFLWEVQFLYPLYE
jgi:hypothetical protein